MKNKDVFKKSVKTLLLDKGISRHNSDFIFYENVMSFYIVNNRIILSICDSIFINVI